VRVRVVPDGDATLVEVADDGVGGADPSRGSGLRGLSDRVAALDGVLQVESEPGRGTTLRAVIPTRRHVDAPSSTEAGEPAPA
jgi:signal transduction histidine kinase